MRDDALAAGFFDALIGNQDRRVGQFRYDEANRALGLIDHRFSFPSRAPTVAGRTSSSSAAASMSGSSRMSARRCRGSSTIRSCSDSPASRSPIERSACVGAPSGCSTWTSSCSRGSSSRQSAAQGARSLRCWGAHQSLGRSLHLAARRLRQAPRGLAPDHVGRGRARVREAAAESLQRPARRPSAVREPPWLGGHRPADSNIFGPRDRLRLSLHRSQLSAMKAFSWSTENAR